ncbi:MBL fold metallo-hydrolase [Thermodesulfobacteriota bacterium]
MVEEIRSDLFRVKIPLPKSPLKYLNSYIVRSPDKALIVDTGLNRSECYEAMQQGLKHLDIDLARTDFFITHLHADHFGLVSELITPSSRLYFNRQEVERMKTWGGWSSMVDYATENGFPKDEANNAMQQHPGFKFGAKWVPEISVVDNGDMIAVGDYQFECVQTPGHTPGHTCLFETTHKIFMAGDHILDDITPNIQCWSDEMNPLKSYLESLDRVYDLDIELVLPGHRRLIESHRDRINQLKEHHQTRCDEIPRILKMGAMSAYEVASKMTWDIDSDSWESFPLAQKWFAVGEAISHLRYMEKKRQLKRIIEDDHIRFALNEQPAK